MANIIFSEASGVNDSVYGKIQTPIKVMIEEFAEQYESEDVLKSVFAIENSKHFAEAYSSMTSMNDWEPVGENGTHPSNGMEEGYTKTLPNETWKSHFSVSREMIDDQNLIELKQRPKGFVSSYYRTRQRFGAKLYGGAIKGDSTVTIGQKKFDITCADGMALYAKAHKNKVNGKTQCNLFSDAVSNDAILYMESAMQNFKDDNGNLLDIRPDTIVIPNIPSLKKSVFTALGADKDPDTANNGFNYNFGRFSIVVWGYLTDYIESGKAPCIMLDSRFMQDYDAAVFQNRVDLEVTSKIEENDANRWNGYSRFSAGFVNWRYTAVGGVSTGNALIS